VSIEDWKKASGWEAAKRASEYRIGEGAGEEAVKPEEKAGEGFCLSGAVGENEDIVPINFSSIKQGDLPATLNDRIWYERGVKAGLVEAQSLARQMAAGKQEGKP
jgi:hypothetical protein